MIFINLGVVLKNALGVKDFDEEINKCLDLVMNVFYNKETKQYFESVVQIVEVQEDGKEKIMGYEFDLERFFSFFLMLFLFHFVFLTVSKQLQWPYFESWTWS